MRDIDFLKLKAKNYELVAEKVNEDTLSVYSPKFNFDSWLIKQDREEFILYHLNRKQGSAHKCAYHVHARVDKKKKIRLLQKIKSHNEYVAFYKKYNKINLVDRVLGNVAL